MKWEDVGYGWLAPSKLGAFIIEMPDAQGSRGTLWLLNASGRHNLGNFAIEDAAHIAEVMTRGCDARDQH